MSVRAGREVVPAHADIHACAVGCVGSFPVGVKGAKHQGSAAWRAKRAVQGAKEKAFGTRQNVAGMQLECNWNAARMQLECI